MDKNLNLFILLIVALMILILGGKYLERPQYKKRFFYLDLDKIIFHDKADESLLLKADNFAFMICVIMSALIFINGLLVLFFNFINLIIFFIAIVLFSWLIRVAFIYYHLWKAKI